jgi:NADH-quinone oxidoreductase subunit F
LGCREVHRAFEDEIRKKEMGDEIDLKLVGCPGFCEIGPIVVIRPKGIFYQKVKAEHVPQVISRTVQNGDIIDELLYVDPTTGRKAVCEDDVGFYKSQERVVIGNNDKLDPLNIEDYIALGGYGALNKALFGMTPDGIIEEVKLSGLRGRGGGGFPTGRKWESCRKAKGDIKYVICNADEGDPGAFMDRSLLEGNPHSVLEGMLIGAYAIGSSQGYVYVRNEYPLALEDAQFAIQQAEECGLLGDDILGSGFSFSIKVSRGGGAFVCGESTALMASLEGKRGEPRPKYIHTVESGLWNKPSNLNNVETWANVPVIVNRGAEWYRKIGTEGSKGTKIFSLVGNIKNTGLVEVPMGTTFDQMIFEIGGGIPNGKTLKAVQIGGPSGGCIPSHLTSMPIDYDALTQVGAMMGSGGMIVMDEDTCMVDIAKYFVDFLKDESCGKCTPCREGLYQMGEILDDVSGGRGTELQLDMLRQLADVMRDASLCALGQTAANPVLSSLRYFKDEYLAHIREQKCPAGVCKELIEYSIGSEECNGCGRCIRACPQDAISGEKKEPHEIDVGKCIKCDSCYSECKFGAIVKG